ncbi:hypothetical protein DERF_007252 [Dermatophagoides farinae]|uniref:Uncharacterized protein n=1 Tax=Dermatophagoides farinae TaxID=6954 RepID=A0A922HZZ9_DERFA|nr:hypothetical protein DERF_007252 [Dermatophagoides farinae]
MAIWSKTNAIRLELFPTADDVPFDATACEEEWPLVSTLWFVPVAAADGGVVDVEDAEDDAKATNANG